MVHFHTHYFQSQFYDCKVTVNGVDYFPHEGEAISVRPVMPVAELEKLMAFYEMANNQGETEDSMQKLKDANSIFDEACTILSTHILGWNWTNNEGEALPTPNKNPEGIKQLSAEEIFYLLNTAMSGGNTVDQKNVTAPLQTT